MNENGIDMKDDEDLSTANEKFLGKIIKKKVLFAEQALFWKDIFQFFPIKVPH